MWPIGLRPLSGDGRTMTITKILIMMCAATKRKMSQLRALAGEGACAAV